MSPGRSVLPASPARPRPAAQPCAPTRLARGISGFWTRQVIVTLSICLGDERRRARHALELRRGPFHILEMMMSRLSKAPRGPRRSSTQSSAPKIEDGTGVLRGPEERRWGGFLQSSDPKIEDGRGFLRSSAPKIEDGDEFFDLRLRRSKLGGSSIFGSEERRWGGVFVLRPRRWKIQDARFFDLRVPRSKMRGSSVFRSEDRRGGGFFAEGGTGFNEEGTRVSSNKGFFEERGGSWKKGAMFFE